MPAQARTRTLTLHDQKRKRASLQPSEKQTQRHCGALFLPELSFSIPAGIVQTLCEGIAKYCPKAWVAIISNPVNSTVPIAAEVFKRAGEWTYPKLRMVTARPKESVVISWSSQIYNSINSTLPIAAEVFNRAGARQMSKRCQKAQQR